jgi:hypothetical protein
MQENTDKIKECVKKNIFMNQEEQEKHEPKKRIEEHIEGYRRHLLMLDIHGDRQTELIKEELNRFIKTLEKEEKLKRHINNYVIYLQTGGVPITEDMIAKETKRFEQVLENENQ